jgi:hypothetical protein
MLISNAVNTPSNDELRGYLMGLEDGYVEAAIPGLKPDFGMSEFGALCDKAREFVRTKGDQFYRDHVETVNFNPDGTRSEGWDPGPEAKPRQQIGGAL